MIDKWFIEDVRNKIADHRRLVITDTTGEGAFLIKYLNPRRYMVLTVSTSREELTVRHEAERDYIDKNVVFYTSIPRSKLTMLQEYAATCGCIELDDMEAYIKQLLFSQLGIHTNIGHDSLLLAAKMSKDKDENWWRAIAQGIKKPLEPKEMLLTFLRDPKGYANQQDETIYDLMRQEICRIVGLPQTEQTAAVFATAVMKAMFDKLAAGNIEPELLDIYYAMTDSAEMEDCYNDYLAAYALPGNADPLAAHADHPFVAIDEKLFRLYAKRLTEHADCADIAKYIASRLTSNKARRYKASWLHDVLAVLKFELGVPHNITSLSDFAAYYRDRFAPLDTAMRHLYEKWLNEQQTIRPVQEEYETHLHAMLDAWFLLVRQYQPTQQGLLAHLFNQSKRRTAIIVCDGLRLEMAEAIANRKFAPDITVERNTAWSKLPSVTPNGMSALYGMPSASGDSVAARNVALKADIADVEIMQLTRLNGNVTAAHLVLLYGNIDMIGEHVQLAGLSEIASYEGVLYSKIKELLQMGYSNVYLTTDHGYVITGLLDESQKIVAPYGTKADERYATAEEQLHVNSFVERHDDWTEGKWQYYAKSDRPFRTKGAYGYSHGGFTPQECLIPAYRFSNDSSTDSLTVTITNKAELADVTGLYFKVKLHGEGDASNVFTQERKVRLYFYDQSGKEVSKSAILTVKHNAAAEHEDELTSSTLKVVAVDAITTEQLDSCLIKKSSGRDLDDLL